MVISVIGQELLQAGKYQSAVTVLESALRIGSCSLKLRGSVFSALSSAYWALNQLDKAIGYMQQDLAVAKSLGERNSNIRVQKITKQNPFSSVRIEELISGNLFFRLQVILPESVERMET